MASARDMDWTYTQIDRLFRLSLGETADFSGAKYDGDFTMSLEDAQRRKHEYVAEHVRLQPGSRVIDLTCGWGPFVRFAMGRGARAVGVTLSRGQAAACRRNGMDVHLGDCRTITPDAFGTFDSVVSIGGFEHFCSPEQYAAGKQDAVYDDFFRRVHALLPTGGRFFLQTMVFGPNMIAADRVDANAPRGSDEHVLYLLGAQFPGSWLPYGLEQVERTAAPHFRLLSASSGRIDYIETINQWTRRIRRFSVAKLLVKATLAPIYLTSRQFRDAFASGISANQVCFQRELLDHYRIVFEKL